MSQKPVRSIRLTSLSATNLNNTLGLNGEIVYDVTNKTLRIFDSDTQGGYRLARQDQTAQITLANVTNGTVSAKVLASGVLTWNNVTGKPTLFDGSYASLTGRPTLSTVATTGSYNDLVDTPNFFSGSYNDLSNKPTSFTNITGITFTSGVAVSEFSNDLTFTDNSSSAVPTEAAVRGYIDRRLGFTHTGSAVAGGNLIGSAPFATKSYVDTQISGIGVGGSINTLTDVDTTTTPPSVGQVLKWNGTNWVPATDATSGGAGLDADTLDGQDGSYYLNYANLSGKPNLNLYATLASPTFTGTVGGITAAMVGLGNVTNEGKATMFASPTFTGTTTLQQSTEVLNTKTSATGTVVHDFATGSIWYHSLISANFTANFTNVPATDDRVTVITLVLAQGGTPRIPNAVQINSVGQTINWLGGTTPTGFANKTDLVSFSLVRTGSAWTVIGALSSYG